MDSVFIATPYSRPLFGGFVASLVSSQYPGPRGWEGLHGKAIDVARNILVGRFLEAREIPRCDWILFVDGDCTFHPDAITRLISRDLPVVCGCMYTRTLPPTPTMGDYIGVGRDRQHYYRFAPVVKAIAAHAERHGLDESTQNELCLPETPEDLRAVDGCGMHFTLIRRDVMEALEPPWFVKSPGSEGGEDFYFTRQAKAAGFPVYADLSVHTGHLLGEDADFGLREMLAFMTYVDQSFGVYDRIDEEVWEVAG